MIDRETPRAGGQKHPDRDDHRKAFQFEKAGRPSERRFLFAQKKTEAQQKRGACIEGKGLKPDEGIVIKIRALRNGGIGCRPENGRAPGYPRAENGKQTGKSTPCNEGVKAAGGLVRHIIGIAGRSRARVEKVPGKRSKPRQPRCAGGSVATGRDNGYPMAAGRPWRP